MGKYNSVEYIKPKRAVFLDRDGVINKPIVRDGKPYPPAHRRDFVFFPGVVTAVDDLIRYGYVVIVVTNQPDVGNGLQKQEVVEKIHDKMLTSLKVHEIKVCYHREEDNCFCRKPSPGMILESAQKWSIDLSESFMIGDRWRDIEAGKAAGCRTIWIRSNYTERAVKDPDLAVDSLLEASNIIISSKLDVGS